MTPAQIRLLFEMSSAKDAGDYADAEVVCCGIECWIGLRRVSWKTLKGLLQWCAISEERESKGVLRYTLNATGEAALDSPEVEQRVKVALASGVQADHCGFPLRDRYRGRRLVPL